MNKDRFIQLAAQFRDLLQQEQDLKDDILAFEGRLKTAGNLTNPQIATLKRNIKRKLRKARLGAAGVEEFVYFALWEAAGVVKIGTSRNPTKRVAQIEGKIKGKLKILGTIPGGFDIERRVHFHFAPWRENGEWFAYSSETRPIISNLLRTGQAPESLIAGVA